MIVCLIFGWPWMRGFCVEQLQCSADVRERLAGGFQVCFVYFV
jgi:hypothetical protein